MPNIKALILSWLFSGKKGEARLNQRYSRYHPCVQTCKTILHNTSHLDQTIRAAQRHELKGPHSITAICRKKGETKLNQRYVDTVRACKTILHNTSHLDQTISAAQRHELNRLFAALQQDVARFLTAEEDMGLWVGEELSQS